MKRIVICFCLFFAATAYAGEHGGGRGGYGGGHDRGVRGEYGGHGYGGYGGNGMRGGQGYGYARGYGYGRGYRYGRWSNLEPLPSPVGADTIDPDTMDAVNARIRAIRQTCSGAHPSPLCHASERGSDRK